MVNVVDVTPGPEQLAALREEVRHARAKAVAWVTSRMSSDGRPEGADQYNGWWRGPWALQVAGAPDAAAAMLGWIEREALTDDGDLRPGPFGGSGPSSPVYLLSPIAIGAHLLTRYDTARNIMDRLEYWTDQDNGGAHEYRDFASRPLQDMLKTGQLGISALITGRRRAADGVYQWIRANWEAQPDLPGKYYSSMSQGSLVTDFPAGDTVARVVDFNRSRQYFFHPGIAAAFLAGYGGQTGTVAAIELADQFLSLNRGGTQLQFSDRESVQICKFGWGAAALHDVAPHTGQLPWVIKMARWFVDRQEADGSWGPSPWTTPTGTAGPFEYYVKTLEHLMELTYIEQSLAATA